MTKPHPRQCWECGRLAMHDDNAGEAVKCSKCGSMDTRPVSKPKPGAYWPVAPTSPPRLVLRVELAERAGFAEPQARVYYSRSTTAEPSTAPGTGVWLDAFDEWRAVHDARPQST